MKKAILILEILVLSLLILGRSPLETPEFSWDNYSVITHALGGLEEKTYLNAKESFLYYYEKGCRLFEVDLSQTSDGAWVCRHNWKEPMGQWEGETRNVLSLEEFLSRPIYGKYTPMSLTDLFMLLKEHPDAFVLLDSKAYSVRNYKRTLEDYADYVSAAREAGLEEVLDQVVPEIYNEAMYSGTALLYDFPSCIFSLWEKQTDSELCRIADFCREKKIPAVTVYSEYWSGEVQKIFDRQQILVYIYTVNDAEEAKEYISQGAAGI